MQTFITHSFSQWTRLDTLRVCELTAQDLDPKRLGKQRVEAKQIYEALVTGKGWIHHPATKMWRGHEEYLALYGHAMCVEWIGRGFEDSLKPYFADKYDYESSKPPWWFGDERMVATHRSKLYRKLPEYYGPKISGFGDWPSFSPIVKFNLPYIWPGMDPFEPYKKFYLSKAEFKRIGEWQLPPNWKVRHETREVVFT